METELTQEQIDQIADEYLELADAVRKYRDDNFDALSDDERKKLRSAMNQLLSKSAEFTEKGIKFALTAPKTKEAVNNIVKTTGDLKDAVKKLKAFNKIIGVAAAAISLGVAVVSGNPQSIADAIGDAVKAANA